MFVTFLDTNALNKTSKLQTPEGIHIHKFNICLTKRNVCNKLISAHKNKMNYNQEEEKKKINYHYFLIQPLKFKT